MNSADYFEDLPRPYRLAAATVLGTMSLASLIPWFRVGPIIARPNPPWIGLLIGLIISVGASWFFGWRAWRLLFAPVAEAVSPERPPRGIYSPTSYWLFAALFGLMGLGGQLIGVKWFEGLPFLISVGTAGEGYRALKQRRALRAASSLLSRSQ